jgi:PAS domain S-box-containing protein
VLIPNHGLGSSGWRDFDGRYRALFESLDEAFCLIELLFDPSDEPVDYRFAETNAAFAAQTGVRDAIGKRMRELAPHHEDHWLGTFARIVRTGQPERFTAVAPAFDNRWYDVFAFPIGPPPEHTLGVLFKDVTAQKREHDALRASEERMRLAMKAASVMTWELDVTTGLATVSDNYADVFGFDMTERPNEVFAAIAAVVHPDDRADLTAALQRTARGEGDLRCEFRVVHPTTGAVRWTEATATLIGGGDQGPARIVAIARNITQRMRAEAAMRAAADRDAYRVRLSDTLRHLADPLRIQAESMRVLRQHLGAIGAQYVEIDGDDFVVVVDNADGAPPVSRRYVMTDFGSELAARLRRGEHNAVDDVRMIGLSPEIVARYEAIGSLSHATMPLIKHAQLAATVTVFHAGPHQWTAEEITVIQETTERTWSALEQARVEAALRVSEERKRLALDTAAMGSFIWYPQENRSEPDDLLLKLLGVPRETPIMQASLLAPSVHPDDRERFSRAVDRSIDPEARADLNEEIRVMHPNGAEVWLAVSGRAKFEANPPRAVRMVGVATDITERKQNEARLREADQRKDEFLAMLAHELRNPLAPIRTGLELIRVAGDTPNAVERVRSMMQRQVAHMVRLIDDLLDVSRITSGKIRLQREPTPLNSLVESAIEANRAALSAKGLALSVDLPDSRWMLDVDPTRFVQVLSNVLQNATKFTEPGGRIQISARVDDSTETPAERRPQVTLSVKDSGIGISSAILPYVFDLFTQENRGSSQAGLGIGLALARRLIEMHGGRIEARSEGLGRGSELIITLPLSARDRKPRSSENIREITIERRVLVIDDNEDAANATAMLVEALGGESRVAYCGDEGIREALAYRPDTVLLDIGMPGIDGYETCRRIRQELGQGVFLVALTGFAQEHDKNRAVSAGFNAHLTKPADFTTLAALLNGDRSART